VREFKPRFRRGPVYAGIVAVVALLAVAGVWFSRQMAPDPAPTAKEVLRAAISGKFSLIDHTGQAVTEETYRGKWLLVFFGYTYCPDVCPLTLSTIADVLAGLGTDAAKIQPLFISIDPDRDTPAVLAKYVTAFHPRLVGLTGGAAAVQAAAKSFRVYYAKAGGAAGPKDYLMDHTGYIYLMTPTGLIERPFSHTTPPQKILAAVRAAL